MESNNSHRYIYYCYNCETQLLSGDHQRSVLYENRYISVSRHAVKCTFCDKLEYCYEYHYMSQKSMIK